MDTIKQANKIIKDGIALLPDDAKGEFKAQTSDIFINEAIANAMGAVNEDEEKTSLLKAYAVQEANRIVTTLWRLQLLPDEMEKSYRELPVMTEVADEYNKFTSARKERMDKIMEDHKVIGYAMVDISMDKIRAQQAGFIRVLTLTLAAMTIVISILAILAVNHSIIRPINMLSHAAASYSAGKNDVSEIDSMKIRTRDEIESLYMSIRKMLHDITSYIDNLVATTNELSQTRNKADAMTELAHTDALTGVGSMLSYERKKEELSEGDGRYGIVMADLNNLKTINDTDGHSKGDEAIRKVCAALCDAYKHSPVYRIGGDEFVVVVTGRDYDQIGERAEDFKRNMVQSGGGISAAIGYALHEEGESVEDVFRRADSTMYENKKRMKRKSE